MTLIGGCCPGLYPNAVFCGIIGSMIQKTRKFKNYKGIQAFAQEAVQDRDYEEASCRLLFVWYELWEAEKVKRFAGKLAKFFPDALISATCYHDRDDILTVPFGPPKEGGFLISLMFFEKSDVCIYQVTDEKDPGKALNERLRSVPDVKGVYLNPDKYQIPFDTILEEASKGISDVQFFGMKATLSPDYSNFYLIPREKPVFNTLHAVIFSGGDLNIEAHYNLGWTPMGKEMKITKVIPPMIVTHIDDMSAISVYTKYLGLGRDQINPWNICDFPLVQEKNGILKAYIGLSDPAGEGLSFGIPVREGDTVRLSYGNPDEIFRLIKKDSRKMADFCPQGMLLFICVNRLMLLRENEHIETDLYTRFFEEAARVYGFAEFHSNKKGGGEYNSALISVSFREGEADKKAVLPRDAKDAEDHSYWNIVPTQYKLFHFFAAMSEDLMHIADVAGKANRAKTDFLSNVSHEIRTPINAILGMDEMILRETDEENIKEYAHNIEDSGKLLLGLINDLLDTARIESGKMEIIPVRYDLSSTLYDIVNIVTPKADSKGLKLSVNVNPEIPAALRGDETRIKQCAINILNNAVKYTQSGSVNLSVDFKKQGESAIDLLISVQDTGIGIKKKDLERLNRPFERLDEKKNYGVEGTGLGLSIVNSFLKLMDSHLDVRSEYGKGSVFSFAVRQEVTDWEVMGDISDARKRAGAGKEAYKESFHAPDASILVADDTEMNLIVITSLLKDTKVKIDTVPGGEEALTMAQMKKYDIIFIDQQMPGMKGLEVLKRIRSKKGPNRDTVCVILTADAVSGAREKYISQGFDDYISKPVSGPVLENLVMKHLPKEKIKSPDEEKKPKAAKLHGDKKAFLERLQSIEEIDYQSALENAGNADTLAQLAGSFARTGSENLTLLEKLLEDRNIEDFTVRVHAVKSSARIMGDEALSKKARALEEMGNQNDVDGIRASFDDFLSDYETLVGKLAECEKLLENTTDLDLPAISDDDLSDYLHRMTLLINEFEYDEASMIADVLLDHDLRDRRAEIEKIKEALEDFDGETAVGLIKELR